ncbi:MAG TPA: type II toxin-antitoxin system prevent-host-death family antitoxin [Pirellulales bacterium]|jgi:prevent-host-death family protein|nr:type II toxin-antitoxin system prevent-host-death family antitoxin [Pirellulales bacterium]
MKDVSPCVVGVYDAKLHFSALLARVARGEEITITRHGAPVARLVPAREVPSQESCRQAIQAMRELASRYRLDGLRVKDLIAEGRK